MAGTDVGGIRIPVVLDPRDIPKGIKQVQAQLNKLSKSVGDVNLRLDGKHIEKLNVETITPLISSLSKLKKSAATAARRSAGL